MFNIRESNTKYVHANLLHIEKYLQSSHVLSFLLLDENIEFFTRRKATGERRENA